LTDGAPPPATRNAHNGHARRSTLTRPGQRSPAASALERAIASGSSASRSERTECGVRRAAFVRDSLPTKHKQVAASATSAFPAFARSPLSARRGRPLVQWLSIRVLIISGTLSFCRLRFAGVQSLSLRAKGSSITPSPFPDGDLISDTLGCRRVGPMRRPPVLSIDCTRHTSSFFAR
jgi:hypothetical protein